MSARWRSRAAAVVMAAQAAALCPAAAVTEWHEVTSPDLVLTTDASPDRGAEVLLHLERFRAFLAQTAPGLSHAAPTPLVLFAFADNDSYGPYKSPSGGLRLVGEFTTHPDCSYLTLDAGASPLGSLGVAVHEYVHYLVHNNFPGAPLWFNEGLAEYYSTFAADRRQAWVGNPVVRHVAWFERHPVFSLEPTLSATPRRRPHGGEQSGELYALSWGLVHYLLSGDEARLDAAADIVLRLRGGELPRHAVEGALGLSLARLEEELGAYQRQPRLPAVSLPLEELPVPHLEARRLSPAEASTRLGELLLHQGRLEASGDHFRDALVLDQRHGDALAGLAQVLDAAGRTDEARLLWRDAEAAGLRHPPAALGLSRHYLGAARSGGPDRSDRARSAWRAAGHALTLFPDYAQALLVQARAWRLADEKSPDPGIAAAERAVRLLPEQAEPLLELLAGLLAARRFDRASELVAGEIAALGDPGLLARAEQETERSRLVAAAQQALDRGDHDEALRLFDEAVSATSDPVLRESMEGQLRALQLQLRTPSGG